MGTWLDDEDSDDDDEEETWEDFITPSLLQLTGWVPSPLAARLWGWCQRRHQSTGQTTFTLNDLATGRPLGNKVSHAADVLQPLVSELLQGGVVSVGGDRRISLNL